VSIALAADGSTVRLEVRDNGRGFDTAVEVPEGHRGLRNMNSRAKIVGGILKVESAPGEGTWVVVDVPLR
jgi:two-component system sensor kinase